MHEVNMIGDYFYIQLDCNMTYYLSDVFQLAQKTATITPLIKTTQ